jgi:hypothetical protein
MSNQRFTGTEQCVATDDLGVSRLRDSQLGDARVHDIRNYITPRRCASRASSSVNGCFR